MSGKFGKTDRGLRPVFTLDRQSAPGSLKPEDQRPVWNVLFGALSLLVGRARLAGEVDGNSDRASWQHVVSGFGSQGYRIRRLRGTTLEDFCCSRRIGTCGLS